MLDTGSSITLCPINYSILTQNITDNLVNYLNSGLERGFTASLVSYSVLSTAAVITSLFQRKFVNWILPQLKFLFDASVNMMPSPIGGKILGALLI